MHVLKTDRTPSSRRRQRAADLVEYGLLMALIAVVVLLGVGTFGGAILKWFSTLAGHITTTGT